MPTTLSISYTDYEWLEPITTGRVDAEGLDVETFTDLGGAERHARMMNGEFDVAEFSLGTYITGWTDWDFTALPIFPRRFFPHSRTFVHQDANIETPADLEGKRVWIHSYQNSLALWAKGIYSEEYGLDPEAVDWYTGSHEPYPRELPVDVTVTESKRGDMLKRGEVDAAISPTTREFYPLSGEVTRLYTDLQAEERTYYETTGYYPVMHTVVVRDELLEAEPWIGTELFKLFRRSHAAFSKRIHYEARYPLVWWQPYREEESDLFGDVWAQAFEFDANAEELSTLIRYASEQGLIDERPEASELFYRADQRLG